MRQSPNGGEIGRGGEHPQSETRIRTFGTSRANESANRRSAGESVADHQRFTIPGMAVHIAARRTAASLQSGGGAGNVERNRYELGKEERQSGKADRCAAAINGNAEHRAGQNDDLRIEIVGKENGR